MAELPPMLLTLLLGFATSEKGREPFGKTSGLFRNIATAMRQLVRHHFIGALLRRRHRDHTARRASSS